MHTDDQTPDEPRAPSDAERTPETAPNSPGEAAPEAQSVDDAEPAPEAEPAPKVEAAPEAEAAEDEPVLEAEHAGEDDPVPDAAPKAQGTGPGEGDRIAKVLSRAGVASRRDAERLILEGRVTVNGKTVESPALNVTDKDRIAVDGDTVGAPEATRLWLYHKPAGLVTTEADEEGRPTVFESLPDDMPRVMSVGRLDMTSEGLLILTNDGEIKRRLELPSTGWSRRYRVRIHGTPTDEQLEPLRQGITVDGEDFQPMEVGIDRQQGSNAWLSIALREGKNREIRRAMEHLGFTVNRLIRVSYGPFQLGDLPVGDVEEVRPKVVRDQLGLGKPGPVTRARKARKDEEDMPVFDNEPEDRPERERLATARPEGASVRRELKPRAPKARGENRDEGAPRGRGARSESGSAKELFAKPRTYMRVDEDRARAASRAEAEARGENERPRRDAGDRPRSAGFKSHGGPRREGGEDRPRSAGFRSHRDEAGDRPARAPREGDGDRKPRWSRDDRSERPARDGDRPARPYKPREGDDRPARAYKPRTEGDRPARPYKPRVEGDRAARPYKPREDGDRPARPYKPRAEGDRPTRAYKPREEGDRPARPYKPRAEGDRPARAYKPREGDDRGPRRGFEPSRPARDGDRPARPYKPREGDEGRPYKPRAPRDGDAPRGTGAPRGDRPPRSAGPGGLRKGPPRSGAPSGPRGPKPRRG